MKIGIYSPTLKLGWKKQDWEGNALDKDLLGDSKIYSEDTCVFLPPNINGFINESSGTKYPLGVHLKFTDGRLNCFVAQTMVEDKKAHLGVFSDEFSVHRAWQMAKIKEVSRLIDKYTDYFTDRKVIYALTNIKDRISLELREGRITESVVDARLNKVRMFALNCHKDQKYGERPYSYHLDSVASKCKFLYGYDEALAMVAYNHDNLEDTDCEYETIGHACGWKVADAVVAVTKVKGESYKDYIKRVRANDLGLKVKIADTLCNLEESIKIDDTKRIKKYTKQLQLLCE